MPGNLPARKRYTWNTDSAAYYSSDGKLRAGSGVGQEFGPPWVAGDVVGCGIKFDKMKHDGLGRTRVQVFFTRNGHKLGTVLANLPADGLRPAIGMCAESPEGAEVRLCLNAIWEKSDVILMSIDNWEEEWARRHDIRLNGQLLEYTGRGKNITDVGLAQARHPLNTTNHYFEIEIIDPGENCYIAIGLARKDYPKHRHPGWNKGSIGYHADDGKIFIGSGVGEPFGPRCHKGETMGCGILFPRDYSAQADCGPTRVCDLCEDLLTKAGEDEDNCHSSESEDEEWWERPYAESGTRVQVFFTRNGKTIGQREIRIAKGGFYPTIGMLSSNEKKSSQKPWLIVYARKPLFKTLRTGLVMDVLKEIMKYYKAEKVIDTLFDYRLFYMQRLYRSLYMQCDYRSCYMQRLYRSFYMQCDYRSFYMQCDYRSFYMQCDYRSFHMQRLYRNAGKDAAVPVAAITATSLPVTMTVCGASDSVNVGTSDAGIVKVPAALPSSASRSRKKLALMGDDSRPVSMADGMLGDGDSKAYQAVIELQP
ncbi:SPRY domain-containing protein 3 [Lamellibrachia satsuma]|nr:SPRY domain-containing protein 3 [Lamellibrachia satsuma]